MVLYLVAMLVAEDDYDWLWPLAGLVGAVAAIAGWMAGRPRPHGRSLVAIVLGALVFLAIAGWMVWAASTGNL